MDTLPIEVLQKDTSFEITVKTNTAGHVSWKINAVHVADKSSDADSKYLISVITRLKKFVQELETIFQSEE